MTLNMRSECLRTRLHSLRQENYIVLRHLFFFRINAGKESGKNIGPWLTSQCLQCHLLMLFRNTIVNSSIIALDFLFNTPVQFCFYFFLVVIIYNLFNFKILQPILEHLAWSNRNQNSKFLHRFQNPFNTEIGLLRNFCFPSCEIRYLNIVNKTHKTENNHYDR